jgi:hypothetical protein
MRATAKGRQRTRVTGSTSGESCSHCSAGPTLAPTARIRSGSSPLELDGLEIGAVMLMCGPTTLQPRHEAHDDDSTYIYAWRVRNTQNRSFNKSDPITTTGRGETLLRGRFITHALSPQVGSGSFAPIYCMSHA